MFRELATKRLTSPSRTLHADAKISKAVSGKCETHSEGLSNVVHTVVQANAKPIHPFFHPRPRIQHASKNHDSRCLSLKASSPVASEQTASLYTIVTNQNTRPITPQDTQFSKLPVYSYRNFDPLPTVVYTQHEEEANDLIAGLKPGPIALDIEWRVFFVKRQGAASWTLLDRRVAVVQVADSTGLILIIQIYNMSRFPVQLQSLLENHEIPKIGVNILNDGNKLFRDYGILTQNLVELGALALLADPAGSKERSKSKRKIIGLAKLVQWYCRKELVKGSDRTSNWELKLGRQQIDYAANDVHSSMVVYQKLCSIAQFNHITLTDKKPLFTSDVEWPTSEKYQHWCQPTQNIWAHTQFIHAYQLWHHSKMSLDDMCTKISLNIKLKPATVISWVIGALQTNPSLSYSMPNLIKLVQMDAGSWACHRGWIIYTWNKNLVKE